MPKKYRLSRVDFKNFRGIERLTSDFFSVSLGTVIGRTDAGGACIVSSKVARRAVDRTQLKRRCRPLLLEILKLQKAPVVLLLHAKKAALTADSAALRKDLRNFIKVLGSRPIAE